MSVRILCGRIIILLWKEKKSNNNNRIRLIYVRVGFYRDISGLILFFTEYIYNKISYYGQTRRVAFTRGINIRPVNISSYYYNNDGYVIINIFILYTVCVYTVISSAIIFFFLMYRSVSDVGDHQWYTNFISCTPEKFYWTFIEPCYQVGRPQCSSSSRRSFSIYFPS